MSYEELIVKLKKAAPTLTGLTVDRVIYKRGSGHAYFYLLSDHVAGEDEYMAVRKALRAAFPGVRLSLRIASPSLKEDFRQQPDKYAHVLNSILLREHPALSAWEFDMCYKAEDGRVVLELPDDFCLRYLKDRGLTERLNQAIYDIFCLETDVLLRVSGVREETTARMERERRAEEALAEQRRELARKHEEELKKRREANEEKKRRLIYGRQIVEKPVQVSELTSDSGTVVIAGRRLDYEEKEISGPYFCDYRAFKEIYNIQIRNLERLSSTMFLGVIMLVSTSTVARESGMAGLLEILRNNLRRGDIVTRFSDNIVAMLLLLVV